MATISSVLGTSAQRSREAGGQLTAAIPNTMLAVARILEDLEERKERAERQARERELHPLQRALLQAQISQGGLQDELLRQRIQEEDTKKAILSRDSYDTRLEIIVPGIDALKNDPASAVIMRRYLEHARAYDERLTPTDRKRLVEMADRAARRQPELYQKAKELALEDLRTKLVWGIDSFEEAKTRIPPESILRNAEGDFLPEAEGAVSRLIWEAQQTQKVHSERWRQWRGSRGGPSGVGAQVGKMMEQLATRPTGDHGAPPTEKPRPTQPTGGRGVTMTGKAPRGAVIKGRPIPPEDPNAPWYEGKWPTPESRPVTEEIIERIRASLPEAEAYGPTPPKGRHLTAQDVEARRQEAMNALSRYFRKQARIQTTPKGAERMISKFVGPEAAKKLIRLYSAQKESLSDEKARQVIETFMAPAQGPPPIGGTIQPLTREEVTERIQAYLKQIDEQRAIDEQRQADDERRRLRDREWDQLNQWIEDWRRTHGTTRR